MAEYKRLGVTIRMQPLNFLEKTKPDSIGVRFCSYMAAMPQSDSRSCQA